MKMVVIKKLSRVQNPKTILVRLQTAEGTMNIQVERL